MVGAALVVETVAEGGEGEGDSSSSSSSSSDDREAKRRRYSSNIIKREAKHAVEAAHEGSKVIIRANISYRYSVVRDVLKEVQARSAWQEDLKVQRLKFSGKSTKKSGKTFTSVASCTELPM